MVVATAVISIFSRGGDGTCDNDLFTDDPCGSVEDCSGGGVWLLVWSPDDITVFWVDDITVFWLDGLSDDGYSSFSL